MKTYYYIIRIILLVFIVLSASEQVNAQIMDYTYQPDGKHVIAIIPLEPRPKSIYADTTVFVANRLADRLRQIPGLEIPNILQALRTISYSKAKRNLKSIQESCSVSFSPDPDDLYAIADILNVDKIIIVSGGFDTQAGLLYKSLKHRFNIFDRIMIKPEFRYQVQVVMYEPVSGNTEWRKTYNASFLIKDFYIAAENMAESPEFIADFDLFSSQLTIDVGVNLESYFFGSETSTVKSKILNQPGISGEATDGDGTTDGHPNFTQGISPEQQGNSTSNSNTLSGSTTSTQTQPKESTTNTIKGILPDLESQVLQEYQADILKKY